MSRSTHLASLARITVLLALLGSAAAASTARAALPRSVEVTLLVLPVGPKTTASITSYYRGQVFDLELRLPPRGVMRRLAPSASRRIVGVETIRRTGSTLTLRVTLDEPGLHHRLSRRSNPDRVVIEIGPRGAVSPVNPASWRPPLLVHPVMERGQALPTARDMLAALRSDTPDDARQGWTGSLTTLEGLASCTPSAGNRCGRELSQVLLTAAEHSPSNAHRARLTLLVSRLLHHHGLREEAIAHLAHALGNGHDPGSPWREQMGLLMAQFTSENDPAAGREQLAALLVRASSAELRRTIRLAMAHQQLAAGEIEAARSGYRGLLRSMPTSAAAQFGLAEVALRQGDTARAERAYRRLAALGEASALPAGLAQLRRGDAAWFDGRLRSAEAHFREAVSLADPDLAGVARLRIAMLHLGRGEATQSDRQLINALADEPPGPFSRATARVCAARTAQLDGKLAEAWQQHVALTADPLGRQLGDSLSAERGQLAMALYDELEESGGSLAVGARFFRDHMDFPEIRDRDTLDRLEARVGRALLDLGLVQDALALFQRSLRSEHPDRLRLNKLVRLGEAYLASGDHYRSRATLRFVMRRLPRGKASADVWRLGALLAEASGDKAAAARSWRRALQNTRDAEQRSRVQRQLAAALGRTGDYRGQIAALRAAAALYRNVPAQYLPEWMAANRFELAEALLRTGAHEEAARAFIEAAGVQPPGSVRDTSLFRAATCLLKAGQRSQAEQILADLGPSDPFWSGMAEAWMRTELGRSQSASTAPPGAAVTKAKKRRLRKTARRTARAMTKTKTKAKAKAKSPSGKEAPVARGK